MSWPVTTDFWRASLELLLLTADPDPGSVLPSLSLLAHVVRTAPPEVSALLEAGSAEVAIVDARNDLAGARGLCRMLNTAAASVPVVAVVTEGGLVAVNAEWGVDESLLPGRHGTPASEPTAGKITLGELVIDEGTYTARLRGRPVDLTYKEFELLKYLAQHVGGVFPRAQLLQEVWGYNFFGGTRTVDVHVRRLRAKLGPVRGKPPPAGSGGGDDVDDEEGSGAGADGLRGSLADDSVASS